MQDFLTLTELILTIQSIQWSNMAWRTFAPTKWSHNQLVALPSKLVMGWPPRSLQLMSAMKSNLQALENASPKSLSIEITRDTHHIFKVAITTVHITRRLTTESSECPSRQVLDKKMLWVSTLTKLFRKSRKQLIMLSTSQGNKLMFYRRANRPVRPHAWQVSTFPCSNLLNSLV